MTGTPGGLGQSPKIIFIFLVSLMIQDLIMLFQFDKFLSAE
jgi:hypothetical protein